MNWTDLFSRAEQLIDTVLQDARAEQRALLLQPATRPASLLLLAVGVLWPFEVILDEKNLVQDNEALRLDESNIPPGLLPDSCLIESDSSAPPFWERLQTWQLVLCTSGSTGTPKCIRKSGAGLLAEVRDLAALYKAAPQDVWLSLVSPLHIYGLLHSFLLPWSTRASVEFVSFQDGPVEPASLKRDRYTGVIAVPATWSFVKDLLDSKEIGTLVMSGAPFGEGRRRELEGLPNLPQKAWEILGSTETGGLGYRSLLHQEAAFQCLPSVQIFEQAHRQWVESPYLLPEHRRWLEDHLELQARGRFLHRGRRDRIFKYAGQRYALGEVEKALSEIFHNVGTLARYHRDDTVAQGGWLEAWVEADTRTVDPGVRQGYRRWTQAPFPHVLHFVPQFYRDPQGKIQLMVPPDKPGQGPEAIAPWSPGFR